MATVRQAIERLRETGSLPMGDTPVSIGKLPPVTVLGLTFPLPRSMRQIISSIFSRTSKKVTFAVILCRYQGDQPGPGVEAGIRQFFDQAFTPGTGGLVEFWRDVTFGAIDITGSQVIGWVDLDITRAQGGRGSGVGRVQTVQKAMEAAQRIGVDTYLSFSHVIAVVPYNWTVPGISGGPPIWGTPDPRTPFWIDGSADRTTGVIALTPLFDGDITGHEMGHSLGMWHDFAEGDLVTGYSDPCCLMSQQNSFVLPGFGVPFGPAVCATHMMLQGWLYKHRIYEDTGAWMNRLEGITVPLAPMTDVAAHANLAIKLRYSGPRGTWDYYLEYVRPEGWNRGLSGPFVFVRRAATVSNRDTSIIMLQMPAPAIEGESFYYVEPKGRVQFRVHLPRGNRRFVDVTARML